ncbi:SDR family oxidoreductase [Natronosporangium hydrolyticum]|uniref:SDR family oxidoreductase n=1 Tax=Natronosporangium hydrolyticum TaxID=2811111 RepID=A0A895Y6C0_9ACTN|nr:SDR family oxidoreductase [Natronosporangium hydrolyticum]QSB13297.1 SDR family oxidoreductase [Natronosporangium hydrolyticum]
MILKGKVAVVFGAGGFVGSAVARSFAQEGAKVYLGGRTIEKLQRVADDITDAGGDATAVAVDATDESAVDQQVAALAADAGGLDITFNAISYGDVQGAPLSELPPEHVLGPVDYALRTHLYTVRACARHIVQQGSGAVMTVTGYGPPFPELGSTAITWHAVEGLYRQWAAELGPHGVRVCWLRTGGFRESVLGAAAYDSLFMFSDGDLVPLSRLSGDTAEADLAGIEQETMLKRLPSLAEAGATAAFLASDHARSITATAVNLTSGAVAD